MDAGKKMRMEPLVLRPSQADVLGTSFEDYIARHETRILKAGGICKIVMPASLNPRRSGYDNLGNIMISRSIRQHAQGSRGLYHMLYVEQKPMHITEFKAIALDKENLPTTSGEGRSGNTDDVDLERKFWKNIGIRPPLYGADVEGSLFDEKAKGWNLRRLNTLLSHVLEESGFKLPGVNTPYLYFGQWRSCFAWHTEDLDLYSVNYLHFGAPKQWYVIPPEYSARFEYVIKSQVPELFKACPEYLRHKELLVSPQFLEQYQIPYVRVTQQPREFVITYPGAYHAGFNQGFNCAESVNFATKRWIPIGARAGVCCCQSDAVKIDMRLFRHLVPKSQLPEELLHDTSDEESSDESDSDDETNASDSDGSTTESLAATSPGSRKRGKGTPSSTINGKGTASAAVAYRSKRFRGSQDTDVAQAGKQQVQQAATMRKAARNQTEQADAAVAALRTQQADERRARAAARSGRLSVRERVQLRLNVRPSLRNLSLSTRRPARPTRSAATAATPSTQAAAPAQRPRGARVLQSRSQSAPAPYNKTARPVRLSSSLAQDVPATRGASASPSRPPARQQQLGMLKQPQGRSQVSTQNAIARVGRGRPLHSEPTPPVSSNPAHTINTRHQAQRRPSRISPAVTLIRPEPLANVSCSHGHHHHHHHHDHDHHAQGDDGVSNASGASHQVVVSLPGPEVPTIRTRPHAMSGHAVAPGSPLSPGNTITSPRPRRANAGINRWLTAGTEFEMDDSKWQQDELVAVPSPTSQSIGPVLPPLSGRALAPAAGLRLDGIGTAGDVHLSQRQSPAILPRQAK